MLYSPTRRARVYEPEAEPEAIGPTPRWEIAEVVMIIKRYTFSAYSAVRFLSVLGDIIFSKFPIG
jgi:hypothetical protein